MMRGEVWWVDFGSPCGSEQGGLRPALIVSNDVGNHYAPILIVAPLTSRPKKPLPTHVKTAGGLILCECVTTIDKSKVIDYQRSLSDEEMERVDHALEVALGLTEVF